MGGDDDYTDHRCRDFIDLEGGSSSDGQEPLTSGPWTVRLASRREIILRGPGQRRI